MELEEIGNICAAVVQRMVQNIALKGNPQDELSAVAGNEVSGKILFEVSIGLSNKMVGEALEAALSRYYEEQVQQAVKNSLSVIVDAAVSKCDLPLSASIITPLKSFPTLCTPRSSPSGVAALSDSILSGAPTPPPPPPPSWKKKWNTSVEESSATAASPSQSVRRFSCVVCLDDDFMVEQMFRCSQGHWMCRDCTQRLCEVAISEGNVPRCCNCQSNAKIMDDAVVKLVVNEAQFDRFQRLKALRTNELTRECPNCDALQYGVEGVMDMTCSECQTKFCFLHSLAHKGKSCNGFREPLRETVGAWFWKKTKAQKCPHCKRYVQRNGGCPHMTCEFFGNAAPIQFFWTETLSRPLWRTVLLVLWNRLGKMRQPPSANIEFPTLRLLECEVRLLQPEDVF